MKLFMSLFLLHVVLFAQARKNPDVYYSLGNEIYDNIPKLKNIKEIEYFQRLDSKIDRYTNAVRHTKKLGYEVESGIRANAKLEYLKDLRRHKKEYDFFIKSVENAYNDAKQDKNHSLFQKIVDLDLLYRKKYKSDILKHYHKYEDEIFPQGLLKVFVDEEIEKRKKRYKPKTKEQLKKEKIKRLRKNDKLEQEALEKKLAEELRKKKLEIRRNQEKELFN